MDRSDHSNLGTLKAELIEVARGCTCGRLRMASRAVTSLFEETLRPSGIQGASQFTLLSAIALMGETPITRLAELLLMDRTTVTRTLHSLEEADWVKVTPGQDRRTRIVSITEAGMATLARALPLWHQAQEHMVTHLTPPGWSDLMNSLHNATQVATDSAPE